MVGGIFYMLSLAIDALRESDDRARHAQQVLVAANRLNLLIVDIETGQRGFIITGEERFLQPWKAGRAAFAGQAAELERLAAASSSQQAARAHQITLDAAEYIQGYAVPLVTTARENPPAARTVAVTAEGEQRVDALRGRFAELEQAERELLSARRAAAEATAQRATAAAAAGLTVSVAVVLLSGGCLIQLVVRPVHRSAAMADQVAGGDLTARMPEGGPGEVGALQRAFNAMAGSLQASHGELRRIASEQAALRRVATLVARGDPPPEIFGAVAAETGGVLAAEATAVARYEPDGTATVVGFWVSPASHVRALPVGARWPAGEGSIPAQVRRTGQSARRSGFGQAAGELAAWARGRAPRSSAGSPVFVEGRLWGVIIAFLREDGQQAGGSEARMAAFTELVAMAVANTEGREQLVASRARIVAAADESRRRVERDLHDGIQQRLIALALELRAAAARLPADNEEMRRQWVSTASGLAAVQDELREISRGLHPAILEAGGLSPALRALARRSPVRVELSAGLSGRLPERVEVAAYYVVSEALTNVAKHADASLVRVEAGVADDTLRLLIRDDGSGGADPARGSGLIGLSDRVEALGGSIEVTSPAGSGTSILAVIPIRAPRQDEAADGRP